MIDREATGKGITDTKELQRLWALCGRSKRLFVAFVSAVATWTLDKTQANIETAIAAGHDLLECEREMMSMLETAAWGEPLHRRRVKHPNSRPRNHEGRVYFARAGEDGPIKIGFTTNQGERAKALQTGHADAIKILVSVPGTKRGERAAHKLFAPIRIRRSGEWFAPDPPLLAFIDRLVASDLRELASRVVAAGLRGAA